MIGTNPLNASTTALFSAPAEFTGACSTGNTSQTTTIDQTRIQADVYNSLTALGSNTWCPKGHTTAYSRAAADDRLRAVQDWAIWSDLIWKRFTNGRYGGLDESGLAAAYTTADALRFCLAKGISVQLGTAIDTARKQFSIIGTPSVRLVRDPEIENVSYLTIEIQVRGTVRDNVISHRSFAIATAKLLGSGRELIRLHYDII
jgi:hypothetical protein